MCLTSQTLTWMVVVPIFNIDKRPFALLCAYNTADHVKPFVCSAFRCDRSSAESLHLI